MKQYKYIRVNNIENYYDWELCQVIPALNEMYYDMAVIMKEDKPIQDYIKLNEATNEQLIEELFKRLNKVGKDEQE